MSYRDPAKQRASMLSYRLANKGKDRSWRVLRKKQNNEYVQSYLASHPCIDCGENDPIVLEFDHRDPSQKKYNISERRRPVFSINTLKSEIEKCDIRCANCHRRRTHKQNKNGEIRRIATSDFDGDQIDMF